MQPYQIRLPVELIDALRAQAESNKLSTAAFIRTQLTASAVRPHAIIKTAKPAR